MHITSMVRGVEHAQGAHASVSDLREPLGVGRYKWASSHLYCFISKGLKQIWQKLTHFEC